MISRKIKWERIFRFSTLCVFLCNWTKFTFISLLSMFWNGHPFENPKNISLHLISRKKRSLLLFQELKLITGANCQPNFQTLLLKISNLTIPAITTLTKMISKLNMNVITDMFMTSQPLEVQLSWIGIWFVIAKLCEVIFYKFDFTKFLDISQWKFKHFSVTQNLREIKNGICWVSKSAILIHLQALNFDFYEFLHFL